MLYSAPNTSECPASNYLETLSTGEDVCVSCPDKTISTIPNSRVCTCFHGYYRTHLETPSTPCTGNLKSNHILAMHNNEMTLSSSSKRLSELGNF